MLDEQDGPTRRGSSPSSDEARWRALEMHLQGVAEAAANFEATTRSGRGHEAWLAGVLHDIGEAQAAFHELARRRSVAAGDPARPVSRRFGAFAGRFDVSDGFFDPLPEDDLRPWSG